MPLNRLVLLVLTVMAAAGATVLAGAVLATRFDMPASVLGIAIPLAAIAYLLWRVIAARMVKK
ncbi:hypothetical protein [Tropicimonas sp. IMCC34043]|uniref:hypothetical protein n=1 Tax=Tropicimonas sp. IMCC34043 TaxID=2248760 RepID=UPI000E27D53A|nr:hypothetical protein [Tropicimonas sp. IMCC34043]